MEDILNKFLDKLEKSIIDKRLEERRKMVPEEQYMKLLIKVENL